MLLLLFSGFITLYILIIVRYGNEKEESGSIDATKSWGGQKIRQTRDNAIGCWWLHAFLSFIILGSSIIYDPCFKEVYLLNFKYNLLDCNNDHPDPLFGEYCFSL